MNSMYICDIFFFLIIMRTPKSTLTDTLFPYTTLFRSRRLYPVRQTSHDVRAFLPGGIAKRAASVRHWTPAQPPAPTAMASLGCPTAAAGDCRWRRRHHPALGESGQDRKSTRLNSSH